MVDTKSADIAPPLAMPLPPDRRGRREARVAWFSARAHNALRRPGRFGMVAGIVFMAALLTLIFVPRQAQRAFAALTPRADEWQDTTAVKAELASADAELARARQSLDAARVEALAPPRQEAPVAVLTADQRRQRDSLQAVIAVLQRELARVERSPLPASYRQLGELPELAGESRVRLLLDSLALVEREREEFAALGGVDPIYVSLTTRVNAIGRAIQGVASRRMTAATAALNALKPPPAPVVEVVERPQVDTVAPLERVAAAERAHDALVQRLENQRRVNAALAERAEAARSGASFVAPPAAVLGAALVVALVLGYLGVLIGELRTPLVADGAEIERETGYRTLAVIDSDSEASAERGRRLADELSPDVLDPINSAYQLLYLHISPTGASLPVVTITGAEPSIVARVAANLAAAAAAEARAVLLVDADLKNGSLAAALRVRPGPGVAELLRGEVDWAESIASSLFGREQVVDIIPAGARVRGFRPVADDAFRSDFQRVADRYDLTVVCSPLDRPGGAFTSPVPSADVILCAHAAVTRLADLHASVAGVREAGMRLQGIVLWS